MDSQGEEKKSTAKLSSKAREYRPKQNLNQKAGEFQPSPQAQQHDPNQYPQSFEQQTQMYEPEVFYHTAGLYMNDGYTQEAAASMAHAYLTQTPQDPEQMGYYQNQQNYYEGDIKYNPNGEQVYPQQEEQEEQKEGEQFEDQFQYGARTKKPYGNRRKDKYHGKHHEKYSGQEEGYYDELGFYYMPDGSFYDPDGFYFDPEGYDKFGGYYDDNANYIPPEGQQVYYKGRKGNREFNFEVGGHDDYYEEAEEDKYTKQYIEYIIEQKYYTDLEYLRNSPSEWAYLTVGNLRENTTKQDLLKFFGNQGLETSQITIVMGNGTQHPVGHLEIYKKRVAIGVLKLCGMKFHDKPIVIEIDEENEKLYGNNYYKDYEYGDEDAERYTKFDDLPEEEFTQTENTKEESQEKAS